MSEMARMMEEGLVDSGNGSASSPEVQQAGALIGIIEQGDGAESDADAALRARLEELLAGDDDISLDGDGSDNDDISLDSDGSDDGQLGNEDLG